MLHAIAGGEFGGAEAFFIRLVRALARDGLDQHVVMRPHEGRAAALARVAVPVTAARFGGVLDLATASRLRHAIAASGPDVVLAWMSRAARFAARARRGTQRGARPILVARLGGYYPLRHYAGCDHLVGNTPDIVDWMVREGWPASRAHFIANFVDADKAPPLARASLATPASARIVLALGRLHPNKAFDVAIEAIAAVPDAVLWIAGEGETRALLLAAASRAGVADRVRLLGWREDVAALMAAADVLVCPSRIEPLGNVVIEAWARGLPVVAAAAAGPRWLIAPETSGLLVPVGDASALAAALRRVLADHDLARRLVAGGGDAYLRDFTERAVALRWRAFFAEITG